MLQLLLKFTVLLPEVLGLLVGALWRLNDHTVDFAHDHVPADVLDTCCCHKPDLYNVIQRAARKETSKMLLLSLLGQGILFSVAMLFGRGERSAGLHDLCRHFCTLFLKVAHSFSSFIDHRCRVPERLAISRRRMPRGGRHIVTPGLFEHVSQGFFESKLRHAEMTALKSKHPPALCAISSSALTTGSVLGVLSATPQFFLHTKPIPLCSVLVDPVVAALAHQVVLPAV